MSAIIFAGTLLILFGFMFWIVYSSGRKIGAREGEEAALKKASKAFEKEKNKVAKKTRVTLSRIPLGDELMRRILKRK